MAYQNKHQTNVTQYYTTSLDQYNNANFASINHSLALKNLNYSILSQELENEASLEDMHMFFVAFQKRTKKIVEQVEVNEEEQESDLEGGITKEATVKEVEEVDLE